MAAAKVHLWYIGTADRPKNKSGAVVMMRERRCEAFRKWMCMPVVLLVSLWPLQLLCAEPNEKKSLRSAFANPPPHYVLCRAGATADKCDHKHIAFSQRAEERAKMVAEQIEDRDINDPNVLRAMRVVPRHFFVPASRQTYAYSDIPLPIGQGQTISQPYIVAFMTEAMRLAPGSRVLEIGTGSGYQAAVCAEIAAEVYTMEIIEGLAKSAELRLKELGYKNVFVKFGDGYFGWEEKGPFDAIIGTAAAERIPPPLLEQLKPAGRMILPYENEAGFQYLVLVTKDEKGAIHKENVLPVRFVPMTGRVREGADKSER
ncbi:MAG: protein-L-isoaspartate(D-aspartate) O-methyltransferase [Sedimentisphaerales bacterium]|nr:protein-L-isoaspartate(D-aspartate) O-methyltransferase [Sedimentisphaerales bacterium]